MKQGRKVACILTEIGNFDYKEWTHSLIKDSYPNSKPDPWAQWQPNITPYSDLAFFKQSWSHSHLYSYQPIKFTLECEGLNLWTIQWQEKIKASSSYVIFDMITIAVCEIKLTPYAHKICSYILFCHM
jgi:hypothetical protein